MGFLLVDPHGTPLPDYEAGAHIAVNVPGGFVRHYSLYKLMDDEVEGYPIAVLRDRNSRGGSEKLVDLVGEGDELMISPPANGFPINHEADQSVLIAGGIGITPILCMAQQLLSQQRDFHIHYCGRSPYRMAFLDVLKTGYLSSSTSIHTDDGPASQKFDTVAALGSPAEGKHLYVCGPGGFMAHVLEVAANQGWLGDHIHREYFSATPSEPSSSGSFEIEIRSTGERITVPAGCSALHALRRAGIDVPFSCEEGLCGTCLTGIISGVPDHRDMYLTDLEKSRNDSFLPCCSRALTDRLILDL